MRLRLPVSAPRLWSSEAPNLYDLLITSSRRPGAPMVVRQRGLQARFELRDGVMRLNGRRIVSRASTAS